jgi:hypothetical protein
MVIKWHWCSALAFMSAGVDLERRDFWWFAVGIALACNCWYLHLREVTSSVRTKGAPHG